MQLYTYKESELKDSNVSFSADDILSINSNQEISFTNVKQIRIFSPVVSTNAWLRSYQCSVVINNNEFLMIYFLQSDVYAEINVKPSDNVTLKFINHPSSCNAFIHCLI